MKRSGGLARTPLPARAEPMKRTDLRRSTPIARTVTVTAARRPRRDTGFSLAVKLLIRTRAGNGDPDQARCEATGAWLGRHGGEFQHIRARGMGGSRQRNNVGNGVLLSPEAHRLAESRDPGMHAMGFWLFSHESPQPVMLHGLQGGVLVGLDDEGHYLDAAGNILGGAA